MVAPGAGFRNPGRRTRGGVPAPGARNDERAAAWVEMSAGGPHTLSSYNTVHSRRANLLRRAAFFRIDLRPPRPNVTRATRRGRAPPAARPARPPAGPPRWPPGYRAPCGTG